MKKLSLILSIFGAVLLILWIVCLSYYDLLDEQAFRWGLDYWMFVLPFACFALAMVLNAVRVKKLALRIMWAVLSLLPLFVVVDMARFRPRVVYSDSRYQFWVDPVFYKLYYGTGLVLDDAGGMMPHWEKLDSCHVEVFDSLGVVWMETWTSHEGKPYEHSGRLLPIDSRFSYGNCKNHTAELDSLLSARIHDTVAPGQWDKDRSVLPIN